MSGRAENEARGCLIVIGGTMAIVGGCYLYGPEALFLAGLMILLLVVISS